MCINNISCKKLVKREDNMKESKEEYMEILNK